MKKSFALAIALIACLVVGSVTVAVGNPQTKKVKTTLTLNYTQSGTAPYNQSVFSGQVKAKKGCKKNREISIPGVGATTSDNSGKYSISTSSAVAPGTYQATAAKKKRKKGNGTKIICKKGVSNTVTVP
jgi:hypothetical protein